MGSDTSFTATGPDLAGFMTASGAGFTHGVEAEGSLIGVRAECTGSTGNLIGVYGSGGLSGGGNGTGVYGQGGGSTGPGVIGVGGGNATPPTNPDSPVGVYGVGGPNADGVQGIGNSSSDGGVHGVNNVNNGNGVIGDAPNGPSAYAIWGRSSGGWAGFFEGKVNVTTDLWVNGVHVTGVKSAVVAHPDGSHRRLYCVESPESWFEDFGFGQLVNGHAHVTLDPDFAALVATDAYHVFVTEYDGSSGLAVSARTATGFDVRATSSTARTEFSYRIVARRKDIAVTRLERVTLPTTDKAP